MDNEGMGLFMLLRLRQGQRQEAIALEELNLLREARGLPPLQTQPDRFLNAVLGFMVWTIGAMVFLFVLAVLYIVLHALLFGIPS